MENDTDEFFPRCLQAAISGAVIAALPPGCTSYEEFCVNLAKPLPADMHLLHMAVGAMGEFGELQEAEQRRDYENVREEAGDIFFYLYCASLHPVLGLRDIAVDRENAGYSWEEARMHAMSRIRGYAPAAFRALMALSDLLDTAKRTAFYGKPIPKLQVIQQLDAAYISIDELTENWEAAIIHNIHKLKTRYGSGSFSEAQANARADKQSELANPAHHSV